jgi:hypothetical protein
MFLELCGTRPSEAMAKLPDEWRSIKFNLFSIESP